MYDSDATHAYRGYRLQALFILFRILDSDPNLYFTPEGNEDLSISDEEREIEVIQVKSYRGLVLSHLEPSNDSSFFHRVNKLLGKNGLLAVKLVNIGPIGPEMENAWEKEGKDRSNIKKKLKVFGFNDSEIERFFERIQLISLEEDNIKKLVFQKIKELLKGIKSEYAFDLLQKWLFDLSETRSTISQNELIDKIQKIGKFLNDRNLCHSEWFTNVIPISNISIVDSDKSSLEQEFFEGVSARYEHIAAGLDFLRPSKMEAIKQGFEERNIVIIHGASGQGKTTLAYRYLHENYPEQLRYQILTLQDRYHALEVAGALSGYAEALETSIIVYFDITPRDQDWIELLLQLARHPFINILVTIREEDFRRANIPYNLRFSDVDLELFVEEAGQIYKRALDRQTDLNFLSFEDAWLAFGEEGGPLLEFVYLLTQTKTLSQRLRGQVKRLKDEVREKKLSPDELKLLKLASVITAYEGKVYLPTLLDSLQLPEPSTTLNNYEQEYLIRLSSDRQYIEALHPIRSTLLMELLVDTDIESWSDLATKALPMALESSWETFLLSAYVYHSENFDELINLTLNLTPKTWRGFAGVLRCLLWLGVKIYVDNNKDILDQAVDLMGQDSFWFVMDLNFAGEYAKDIDGWWDTLSDDLIAPENKNLIRQIRDSQSPKDDVFKLAGEWLSKQRVISEIPESPYDWQDVSEIMYWVSRISPDIQVADWVPDESIVNSLNINSLYDFSNLFFALYIIDHSRYLEVLSKIREKIVIRLADEYKIFMLEELGDTLTIHFLTYPTDSEEHIEANGKDATNNIHGETIERIEIVRRLFPEFEKYGSQGYGHNLSLVGISNDDSEKKGIPADNFPPVWVIRLNGIASGLIRNQMRRESWKEYLDSVLAIRQEVVKSLGQLQKHLNRFFQREKAYNFLDNPPFSTNDWDRIRELVSSLPLLPKAASDAWGFVQPEADIKKDIYHSDGTSTSVDKARSSVVPRKYYAYRSAERKAIGKLWIFYQQAIHAAVINIRTGKLLDDSPQKNAIVSELEDKNINPRFLFLSKINLWEVYNNLFEYQSEFRKLFSEKLDSQILEKLENAEIETLETLLWSWFTFVDKPRTALSNPERQIKSRISIYFEQIKNQIAEILASREFNYGLTKILEQKTEWDGHPAIWIQLDIDSSIAEVNKLDEFISSMRSILGSSNYGSFEYSFVETYIRFIVVILTVEGKSIDGKAYPLKTTLTLMQDHDVQEKPYLYMSQEIPWMEIENDIPMWGLEQIPLANDFESSFGLLVVWLSLLEQLGEMPETLPEVASKFEDYMGNRSATITKALQSFMEAKTEILDFLLNLPDTKINDEITEAIDILTNIDEELIVEDGELYLSSEQFKSYTENLQKLAPYISIIKLIYLFAVINLDKFTE